MIVSVLAFISSCLVVHIDRYSIGIGVNIHLVIIGIHLVRFISCFEGKSVVESRQSLIIL